MFPFVRKKIPPLRATGSGVLPTERLLGQRLCPVPYQPWGEDVWLEDWNLIAIVFDFVIFLLGGVKPPFPLFSMCANSPLSWVLPFDTPAQGVLMSSCEEIPV